MNKMNIEELVLHEDENFIIVNKPCGILSQDDSSSDESILSLADKHHGSKLHLLNRLDRPVSGIAILKKNTNHKSEIIIEKKYLAIAPKGEAAEGTLEHYLRRDGKLKKASISNKQLPGFKKCLLNYSTVLQLDHVDILEVTLLTGRFHQIRAQLAHIGRPIRGDVKYGARRGNKDRSVDLHAYAIRIPEFNIEIVAPSRRTSPLWQRIDTELILKP